MEQISIKENVSISNSGFIFDANSGDTFSCNTCGAEILKLIQQNQPVEAIKEYFLNTYDIDAFTFEKDFYDFISLLKRQQIISLQE